MGTTGLIPISTRGGLRARRWDALVLGSGIAGLVAAARIGLMGQRVLVVEEEAACHGFPGLREPFFLAGAHDGGALDACLRALTLALIDRRRIVPDEPAYQIVWPDLRLDVGRADRCADELVAWGVLKPEAAREWTRDLVLRAEAEREALLAAPLVHVGRGLGRPFMRNAGPAPRGPQRGADRGAAGTAPSRLIDVQLRALSNLACAEPGPEARARLLGAPLAGGAGFVDGPPWLAGLLRRRVESVYGEFRSVAGEFRLVNAEGQPGIELRRSGDLWLGRALVIAAPAAGLAERLDPSATPDFLPRRRALRRRSFHLRVRRSVLPEGMGRRIIWTEDPNLPLRGINHVTVSVFVDREDPDWLDLVARCVLEPDEDPEGVRAELMDRLRGLFPFSDAGLRSCPLERPRWDDDGWLEDPERESGGMAEPQALRVSARPPVYRLDRAGIAEFGLEGDLLLGWRAGDVIASELA